MLSFSIPFDLQIYGNALYFSIVVRLQWMFDAGSSVCCVPSTIGRNPLFFVTGSRKSCSSTQLIRRYSTGRRVLHLGNDGGPSLEMVRAWVTLVCPVRSPDSARYSQLCNRDPSLELGNS